MPTGDINIAAKVLGMIVAAAFVLAALTPAPNYAAAHFVIQPVVRPAGAIVVLGAGIWKGDMLDDESLRRTIRGIELYKANLAPVVVFSGPGRNDEFSRSEAKVREQLAVTMGVPRKAILTDEASNTTKEESIDISAMLAARKVHSVLLVTESLHLRRATYAFQRAGMEVYPVASDNFSVSATSPGERLQLTARILEEIAALIVYRLAGYF